MPTDLDRRYAALRAYADVVPLNGPEVVRRRGQRLHRNRMSLVAAAVAFLVVGTASGIAWIGTARRNAPPPTVALPPGPTAFVPLTPFGDGVPMRLASTPERRRYGIVSVVGDRAIVAAQTVDGTISAGAIDLATGASAWPTRDLGHWGDWGGMFALPQGVIVFGEHDDGTTPDHVAMVLDPAGGALRWQIGVDDLQLQPFDSVLVVSASAEGVLRGLDWATGRELWRIPAAAGARLLANDVAPPESARAFGTQDNQLLVVDPDGTLHVYDARSGASRLTRPHAVPAATEQGKEPPQLYADQGVLYSVTDQPLRVQAYDWGAAKGETLYTGSGDDPSLPAELRPCGPGRLCLTTGAGRSPADQNELMVIDEAGHRVLWRHPAASISGPVAVGDRILTADGELFDRDGRQLFDGSPAQASWVSQQSALLVSWPDPASGAEAEAEVSGLATAGGTVTSLGRIPAVQGSCGHSAQILVCPAASGFSAWRFAAG